jgi:hypothetical protein
MIRNYFQVLLIAVILLSCKKEKHEVLIEAESFKEKGGWVVDPQFVEQMGSPYLLAHGLGNPVRNAKSAFNVPAPGNYFVWVRTKNWAPGEWEAPGTFKLIIDGQELEPVLGTMEGWNWQFAGNTFIKDTIAEIELKDLTGFEGRCDAIYLSTEKSNPPSTLKELSEWRKKLLKESEVPQRKESFDLVVVGGGIAGCAAAVAAAEQGMNIALIQDRPVLGGNASNEIRINVEGITWKSNRILSMLNTGKWQNGSPESSVDDKKRQENIARYKNISVFLNYRAYGVKVTSDSITSVDARQTSTGNTIRFSAPLFVDCTGDGWIGYWAGAEYMYGREDSLKYNENLDLYKELWSPARPDKRIMGSSVLWRTTDKGNPVAFPAVPWAIKVAGGYSATEGTWNWEYSNNDLNQIEDAEEIRDHMLMAIYGSFFNAKQKPENENLALEWISYLIGKRESRRLVGDYIYTFQDEKKMVGFPDAVAMEKRDIDVHYQLNQKDSSQPDFLAEALYYSVDHYFIPYRSLYSKNIRNLFMAGRCFSCSHIGLGGPRVMNTTGQMGVAVGYAASLCKKYKTNPRGVYLSHIEELKNMIVSGKP